MSNEPALFETPGNPIPEGAHVGAFRAFDNRRIRYAIFRSRVQVPRGTIVLLHGRNELIEKYFETVRDFNEMGFWVATFDWRGQGGSERILSDPLKGYVRRFSDYERDLQRFIEHVVLPDTRLPFYLVAHSLGGLVALSAAPGLANRIDRMVLSAPFVALGNQSIGQRHIGSLMWLACLAGAGGLAVGSYRFPTPFEGNTLTSDRKRFERNNAIVATVPEIALGRPTARWVHESLTAIRRVTRSGHLQAIRIPTLVISAMGDTIVPPATLEALDRRFRAGHLLQIDGARHELFQERDIFRAQVLAAIDAFLTGSEQVETATAL